MIKKAWAMWKGGVKDGGGTISTETGALKEAPYGFNARFESGKGTNPEELIGAAHAGLVVERIDTHAAISLDKVAAGYEITASHLTVDAKVSNVDDARFQEIANRAKAQCPVSKLLNARITMDAKLEA